MKKLKKISDIPAWFEISRYDKSSSLGLKEWYEQIQRRQHLNDFLLMEKDANHLTSIDVINSWVNLIKTDPIIESNDNVIQEMFKDFDNVLISDGAQESVRDFSAGDLRHVNTAISLNCKDNGLSLYCKNGTYDEMKLDLKTMMNFNNTSIQLLREIYPWVFSNSVALTVNLEASDEQLINDFKSWLKQARKDFNCNATDEMFTHSDFNVWCEYAVLPYFDLTTWAKYNNSEFTYSIMADAIFPNASIDGFCGESRVRRETKRRSAELFNRNTIDTIWAQVRKTAKN